MKQTISFTINGKKQTLEIEGWEKAIDIIRDRLELTGTKRGCDDASCGACTIVLNGQAKRSCVYPASRLDGADIITIEGLARGKELHPIQKALIDAGAVQCGYCIPGIVMELFALYSRNIDAGEAELREALSKHLCRCTGYEAIWEGALLARKYMKEKM